MGGSRKSDCPFRPDLNGFIRSHDQLNHSSIVPPFSGHENHRRLFWHICDDDLFCGSRYTLGGKSSVHFSDITKPLTFLESVVVTKKGGKTQTGGYIESIARVTMVSGLLLFQVVICIYAITLKMGNPDDEMVPFVPK